VKNTTIAIDLAKSIFEVGVSDRPGHVVANHRLSRDEIVRFMANQQQTTVVMEACSSAHYWGRTFQSFGHDVKLLPPLYVRPYVQRSKTDRADVKGMLEAWRNTDIRPVPVKTESQQQLTALHRIRAGWMTARTTRINSARGLLREFGIVFPLGAAALAGRVQELIEDADSALSMPLRQLLHEMVLEIGELESRVKLIHKHLEAIAVQTPVVERLLTVPGIGLLTATAFVGFIGDVSRFPSGRHFAAYLGLTPSEHSSGLRRRLGRISKHGDVYLRTLLIHGARAVLMAAQRQSNPRGLHLWGLQLQRRIGNNKSAVAIANKMARIVWAVWKSGEPFHSHLQHVT
jgi:transposase